MKILYVINHIDWFWSHRLPLAKAAQDSGFDVHVAVAGAKDNKNLTSQNFTGHALPSENVLAILAALHKIIKREQPDIIHAITLKYAFITGLAARFYPQSKAVFTIAGLGYLFSSEGLKPKILRLMISPFLKFAFKDSKIIVQNPDDLEILAKGGFVGREQCVLIRGSGVDTVQFMPHTSNQNPPIVLMPTRLVQEKGIAIFVEAARILKSKGLNAHFQIAGGLDKNNPHAITIEEMQNLTANSTVEWLGRVKDMPALYARATLIAYPSYYREGVPKVLLEAAAMGKPIITTDHPGCREVVKHGENGLLVPIKNPEKLAEAIEQLLQNPGEMARMGKASRARAEAEFDVRLIVEQTLKTYL
jgi:glycosyltransferase involved in cell wall biosynthesis